MRWYTEDFYFFYFFGNLFHLLRCPEEEDCSVFASVRNKNIIRVVLEINVLNDEYFFM